MTGERPQGRLRPATAAGIVLAAASLFSVAGPVSAQTIMPAGACFGVDHFPTNPTFSGAPSEGRGGLALPRMFAGRDVLLVTDHERDAGGLSAGTATAGDDARVFVPFPLYRYGALAYTYAGVAAEGVSLAGQDPAGVDRSGLTSVDLAGVGPFVVDDGEPVCDTTTLAAAPAAAATTTSSVPTTAAAPTTTIAPEPSSSVATTDATDESLASGTASSPTGSTSTSRPLWPLVTGAIGLGLAATGVFISRTGIRVSVPTTPAPISSTPRQDSGRRPVIFVPGIMASALTTRGLDGLDHQVWPPLGFGGDVGKCMEALQATAAGDLAIDDVSNTGLLPGIHRRILTFLDSWGYHLNGDPPNLYVHAYNWMLPCSDAGKSLAALIAKANEDHGRPPTIICHSMGGLVTRAAYHLHGGTAVDQVYFIASPHHGAPMAYYSLHPDIPYQFLPGLGGSILNSGYATAVASNRRSVARVADQAAHGSPFPEMTGAMRGALENAVGFLAEAALGSSLFDDTMKLIAQNATGVLELMPDEDYFATIHPRYPVVRDGDTGAIPATWQECYLGPGPWALPPHLQGKIQAAMDFKKSISRPLPPSMGTKCFVVYGAAHATSTEATVAAGSGGVTGAITADRQGGDATVPKQSGRGEILWPPGCEVNLDNGAEHFMLTETDTVQMILESNLLRGDS